MARDMTQAQFDAALKRNLFVPEIGSLWFRDADGRTRTHYGAVLDPRTMRINRRATLARIMRQRDRDLTALAALAGKDGK